MKRLILATLLFFGVCTVARADIVGALPFTLQNGTVADATQVMADFNAIVNDVNDNAAKSGVNSDITQITGLTTPLAYTIGGTSIWLGGTSTGSANAHVVSTTTPSASFSKVINKRIVFTAGFTNTGATTLNVASTGATNVFRMGPSGPIALTGGEIVATQVVEAVYDGTQYQLVTNNLAILGPLTTLSSATPDLGTIASHNISISGTTTITAFGSTAVVAYPVYYLRFEGALTLTYNATSLILPNSTSLVTAAGDYATALYLGSGNWQVVAYQRKAGSEVNGTQGDISYFGASGIPAHLAAGTSGFFLKTQGAAANPIWAAAAGLKGVQKFITGAGTYTPTSGTASIIAFITGGGGGGGGANNGSGVGGAAGATAIYSGASGSFAYTVGAAGTAGTAGNTGGTGGASALAASGGTVIADGGVGGGGSGVSGNAIAGQTNTSNATLAVAGGGSAAIIPGGSGFVGKLSTNGGASFWGGGGPGVQGDNTGSVGTAWGSGGSGAASSTTAAGGAGASGVILILEF